MFAFRLASTLGVIHPDYLLRRLTARQFAEWVAFDSLDPIGEGRGDLRIAQLCMLVHNMWKSEKQDPRKIKDFLFEFDTKKPKRARKQSARQQLEQAKQIAVAFGYKGPLK